MIPAVELIRIFRRMYDEHWRYAWGAAEEGCVDCSGAFVYAYKRFGESINHGSNALARKYVTGLVPISEARPGMAVFKAREPGEKGYALPDKYKGGALQSDFYHVGLVDTDPAYVLNGASPARGFCRDRIDRNGWDAAGRLSAVDYGGGAGVSGTAEAKTDLPLLKRGATGICVRLLQALMLSDSSVDGSFGPKTEAAVREFQKAHGLAVDGIVGPKTWEAIMRGA